MDPLTVYIVLGVLAVAGATAFVVRRVIHIRKLERECSQASSCLRSALNTTSNTYKRVLANEGKVVLDELPYAGSSKAQHQAALRTWATFVARWSAGNELQQRAQQLFDSHALVPWWRRVGIGRLKEAVGLLTSQPVAVSAANLPAALKERLSAWVTEEDLVARDFSAAIGLSSNSAATELTRFVNASRAAKSAAEELAKALAGGAGESLEALKAAVDKLDLPPQLHGPRYNDVQRLAQKLSDNLRSDPLTPFDSAARRLHRKISVLRGKLKRTLRWSEERVKFRDQLEQLKERITDLRISPVPTAIPGVRIFGGYTLDEPGFDADQHVAECDRLEAQLTAALRGKAQFRFPQLYVVAVQALAATTKLLEQCLADHSFVEKQLATIAAESTPADAEFDEDERSSICDLCSLQQWNAASKAVSTFSARHLLRKTARSSVSALEAELARVVAQVKENEHVVSPQLDADAAGLSQSVVGLRAQADKGSADWAAIMETASSLAAQLCGESDTTVEARLKAELSAHQAAMTVVGSLKQRLQELRDSVGQRWGGKAVADQVTELEPNLECVLALSATVKQSWKALEDAAQQALLLSEPTFQLAEQEKKRHTTLASALAATEEHKDRCDRSTYVRTMCGITYGDGIYCLTAGAVPHLAEARAHLEKRDYEQAEGKLGAARHELYRAHLECWWLALQMMAHGNDPCARQFAREQGYIDGAFDLWAAPKMQACAQRLYQPAVIDCKTHSLKLSLKIRPGDAPTVSDYDGLGMVA